MHNAYILTYKLCACLSQFFSTKRHSIVALVRVSPINGNASRMASWLSCFEVDGNVHNHEVPVFGDFVADGTEIKTLGS